MYYFPSILLTFQERGKLESLEEKKESRQKGMFISIPVEGDVDELSLTEELPENSDEKRILRIFAVTCNECHYHLAYILFPIDKEITERDLYRNGICQRCRKKTEEEIFSEFWHWAGKKEMSPKPIEREEFSDLLLSFRENTENVLCLNQSNTLIGVYNGIVGGRGKEKFGVSNEKFITIFAKFETYVVPTIEIKGIIPSNTMEGFYCYTSITHHWAVITVPQSRILSFHSWKKIESDKESVTRLVLEFEAFQLHLEEQILGL